MTHRQTHKIKLMFELLFERYYQDLEAGNEDSDICREFLEGMSPEYRQNKKKAEIVRDFIAGMTDEFFLNKCHKYIIPQIEPGFA
jgi:dGTPase